MFRKSNSVSFAAFVLLTTALANSAWAAPLGTAFTYQGQLKNAGSPANGQYDFLFTLYNDTTPVAGPVCINDWTVTNGLFTVQLDFGAAPFNTDQRFLLIAVRPAGIATCADQVTGFVTLTPWQPLTPVPFALALPAMRIEQTGDSPNVIGGASANATGPFSAGCTIGGGGQTGSPNRVLENFGTIGGGINNTASGHIAVIAGGEGNTASDSWVSIGGGQLNNVSAAGSTVAGGYQNTITQQGGSIGGGVVNTSSGYSSTIAGGYQNIASADYASVPGGYFNNAGGKASFAAGRQAKANHDGAFVWADLTAADFASTAANQFLIRASGGVGIGTNAPAAALDVIGNNPLAHLRVASRDDSTTPYGAFLNLDATPTSGGKNWLVFSTGATAGEGQGKLVFKTSDGPYSMAMDVSGNVGIGTTAPGNKLSVLGGVTVDKGAGNDGTTGPGGLANTLRFGSDTGGESIGSKKTPGGNMHGLDFTTNYTPRLSITNIGNVGIGTTAPSAKLHVTGTPGTDGIRFPDNTLQTTAYAAAGKLITSGALNGFMGNTVNNSSPNWQFFGPTTNVSLSAGQRLQVNASAALGMTSGSSSFDIDVGYQLQPGGTINSLNGSGYLTVKTVGGMRPTWSPNGQAALPAGTYTIGIVVRSNTAALNDNDYLNLSYMVFSAP